MITMHWLYLLAGAMFAAFAILSAFDKSNPKRLGNAIFWGLMAVSLMAGDLLGDFGNGVLVLCLAALGGFYLASIHLRGKIAPKAVVLIHAGVAVAGFLTLLSAVLAP